MPSSKKYDIEGYSYVNIFVIRGLLLVAFCLAAMVSLVLLSVFQSAYDWGMREGQFGPGLIISS